MKTALMAAAAMVLTGQTVFGMDFRALSSRDLATCASPSAYRVATAQPTRHCCDGFIQCPQLLGTIAPFQQKRPRRG